MLWDWIQRGMLRLLVLITVLIVLLYGGGLIAPTPTIAAIRQLEESPGQVVYQSRQTLSDQTGRRWQTIAFKRIQPDGSSHFYLRLVGFPGTATIDRSQPLTLTNSMGQTLTAIDASSQIFTDANSPEPNVGQYDLQPLLPELHTETPWRLSLPITNDTSLILQVPLSLAQEWQTLADL